MPTRWSLFFIFIFLCWSSQHSNSRETVYSNVLGTPRTRGSLLCTSQAQNTGFWSWETHKCRTKVPFSNMKYPNIKSRYPNIKCSGDYECQISTTPVRSLKFLLQVVGESLNINVNLKFKKSLNINVNFKFKKFLHINVNFLLIFKKLFLAFSSCAKSYKILSSKICSNSCSWYSRQFNNNFAFYEWQFLQNDFLKYNDGGATNISQKGREFSSGCQVKCIPLGQLWLNLKEKVWN